MTNSISELEGADCIIVIGSNTTCSHPLVATRIFRAKQKGARVVVIDPRRIQLTLKADLFVRQNPGSDVALLNGIMRVIISRGWHNQEFIAQRTEGFEGFRKVIEAYTPELASELSGVSVEDIVTIADWYANAKNGSIVYCMGITQHTTGVDNVKSLANLAMLTGNIGRASTGVNPLRGQNNVQGACDMGGLPNVYPGYQPINDPANRAKFEAAWNAKLSDKIGLTIPKVIAGLSDGSVKALYIVGENPMVSDPDAHHVEKALRSAQLLVVQDIFMTPTAELAHVVLPGASFAEKDGTFSNTERRVQRVRRAINPVGEARADWEIIQDVSNRFGYPMAYGSPAEIMEEISKVTPSYGGINFERLEGDGLCWPCPNVEHPGTEFLHSGKFTRGLGLFHPIEHKPPAETVDEEYPYWLSTGRVSAQYHTGTMTRQSRTLEEEAPEGFLEINPRDALDLDVRQGEPVRVISRRGEIETRVEVTERVGKGLVFMPFHYIESSANVLTNSACDPIAGIPEYKVCAVKVRKASC
jgi:formate dehydrogenase alpha subunit